MKKNILALLFILLLLTGCSKETLHQLEEKIREYDYYTEIFNFDNDRLNIQLYSVYNDGDEEVTYVYYSKDIQSDYEILVYVEDEIIYEDFVVKDYETDDQVIGTFQHSDFELDEDIVLAEIRVVSPGFITSDSYVGNYVAQEFYLLSTMDNLDALQRAFVETEDFQDLELEIDGLGALDQLRNNVTLIIVISMIVLYFISLYTYKSYYTNQLQNQLDNPTKKRFLPDIEKYKYITLILFVFLTIASIVLALYIIDNSKLEYEFYDQYQLNYEAVQSETVNLRYGSNTPTTRAELEDNTNQMAFVEKVASHKIIGYVEIITGDTYPVKTIIPESSFGGYEYQVIYRHLLGESFTILVYDRYYGEQSIIFERNFDFDGWGE
jgi:hypothetical protein